MKTNELKKEIIKIINKNDILPEEKNFLIRYLAIISKSNINADKEVTDINQTQIIEMFKNYKKQIREFQNTEIVKLRMKKCINLLENFKNSNVDETKLKTIGHDLTQLLIESGVQVELNTSVI